jgi:PTS system nitrogen regulatory IIA component
MITQYLQPELTFSHVEASSKKRALEKAASIISKHQEGILSEDLFDLLITRERLGSTGIGKGIAIPHCRHDKIQDISCCLITLKESVDFDAIDNNPVDILFILVVPEKSCDQHLETLANLAKLMDNAEYRNQLRQAITNQELFEYAINMQD